MALTTESKKWMKENSNGYVREYLAETNEDMLFTEGFDHALIGYGEKGGSNTVAVYDKQLCIEVLINRDNMTVAEANEFFDYNTLGAYMGQNTPIFVTRVQDA